MSTFPPDDEIMIIDDDSDEDLPVSESTLSQQLLQVILPGINVQGLLLSINCLSCVSFILTTLSSFFVPSTGTCKQSLQVTDNLPT